MSGVDIALAFGQAAAPSAANLLRAFGKRKYDQFIATYTQAFNTFLAATEHKCGTVKTLLNPDVPLELEHIYVETAFDFGHASVADEQLLERIKFETGGFAVTGLAGSGNTKTL